MAHISLDGPKRRLAWAKRHIEAYEALAKDFLDSQPIVVVSETETETGDEVFRAKILKPIPHDLAPITGDAIHSLRSTLDHIAWSLALLKTPTPATNTAFPVCLTKSAFDGHRGSTLRDIPNAAIAVIESVQPYHRTYDPGDPPDIDFLWMLHRLWNDDKHRATPIVTATSRKSRITARNVTVDLSRGNVPSPFTFGPFNDGAEVARIPAHVKIQGDFEMQMTYDIVLDAAPPGHGAQVHTFLNHVHKFLRDEVLPKFTQNF